MKVHIGPYKNWIGPWQIACAVFFWVPKHIENDARWDVRLRDRFFDFLDDSFVRGICDWVHEQRKRKVVIKLDPYDTWSADYTLALIILPVLKQLRATKHGSAMVDDKDVPKHLRSTNAPPKEHSFGVDENLHARWDWALDEMIWTFEQLTDPEDKDLFGDETKKRDKRIENGLRLFGKYYRGLWD